MFCGLLRWGVVLHEFKLQSVAKLAVSVCRRPVGSRGQMLLRFAPLGCCSLNREVAVPSPSSRFPFAGGLPGPEGRCPAMCSVVVLFLKPRSSVPPPSFTVARLWAACRFRGQTFCNLLHWGVVLHDSKLRSRCQLAFRLSGGYSGPEGRRSAICSVGVSFLKPRSCGPAAKLAFPFVGRPAESRARCSAICSAGVSFTTTSSRVPGGVG